MKKLLLFIIICALLLGNIPLSSSALPIYSEPALSAQSAILIDADTGNILFSKSPDRRMGMASTTKIMTALLALERLPSDRVIDIPPEATGIEGSSIYLVPHERLTAEELIYAVLLQSANDAATALAIEISGNVEAFADLMNDRAKEMGLDNTHFTNPHGLYDDDHYTTSYELAIIAMHAMKNPAFARIVSTYKMTVSANGNPRLLVNHNKLLRTYEGCIGIKTGFTKKTGRCLVSAAERDNMRLIAVTLDAPSDWQDHKNMFDFGFGSFESVTLYRAGEFSYSLPLVNAQKSSLRLTNTDEISLTMPKIRGSAVQRIELLHRFEFAPLKEGDLLGELTVSYENVCVSSALIACEDIGIKKQKNFFEKLIDFFKD